MHILTAFVTDFLRLFNLTQDKNTHKFEWSLSQLDSVYLIMMPPEQLLKSYDDAFGHQLKARQRKRHNYDNHVTKIVTEKDREVAQAHQRVNQCRIVDLLIRSAELNGHMIMATLISCIMQVLDVEEEMWELLKEMAAEKRKWRQNFINYRTRFNNYMSHDQMHNKSCLLYNSLCTVTYQGCVARAMSKQNLWCNIYVMPYCSLFLTS